MYPIWPCFSLDICPGVGLQGHMVALFLFIQEPPYCSKRGEVLRAFGLPNCWKWKSKCSLQTKCGLCTSIICLGEEFDISGELIRTVDFRLSFLFSCPDVYDAFAIPWAAACQPLCNSPFPKVWFRVRHLIFWIGICSVTRSPGHFYAQ